MRLRNDKRLMNNGSARSVADMAAFHAPLTTGITLPRGSGTLTYTNTSVTRTYADWEGVIRYAISGQTRHPGCRVVVNLASTINVSAWATTSNVSVTSSVSDPFGGTSAYTITATGASALCADLISGSLRVGSRVVNSCYVRRRTGVGAVSMYNGETGAASQAMTSIITSSWQRICTNPTTVTVALTGYIGFALATSGDAIDVYFPQPEDVVGQSVQTPGELVDPNVQYGMNVVGRKGFPYQNGNTVVSNVVTEATGAAIPAATLQGYLPEPAATNLCLQSQDLNTTWAKLNATINATKVVGPHGTQTAQKIEETTTGAAAHRVTQSFVKAASAIQYTAAASLKQAERSWALIILINLAETSYAGYWFNLATGAIGTATSAGYTNGTPKITARANGFWRCSITGTTDAAAETNLYIYTATGDNVVTYAGVAGSGIYCEDVQLETGSIATSEIPTTTVAVTRNADVLTGVTAGNLDNTIGTLAATITSTTLNGSVSSIVQGTAVQGAPAYLTSGSSNTLAFYDVTAQRFLATITRPVTSQTQIATTWSGAACAGYVSGTGQVTGAFDGNLNIGASFGIGCSSDGLQHLGGTIKNLRIYPVALSAAQVRDIPA